MIRTLVAVLVVGVGVLLGWLGRGWFSGAAGNGSDKVSTCRVARGSMVQHVKSTVGYVKPAPNALVRVSFAVPKDVSRSILYLSVKEGDTVKPGALLAQLDHEDLKMVRDQLEAELNTAASKLESLEKLNPLEISLAQAVLTERQAQRDQSQRSYDRKLLLRKDTLVSAPEVEDAAQDLAMASARCAQAETGLKQVRVKFGTDSLTLKKQIQQTKTSLQAIDTQIHWRELYSPLAVPAVVFAVHQRKGELAGGQANLPVLTLLDPSRLQVHLYIAEADFGRLQPERPIKEAAKPIAVTLRATSYPDRVIHGRITEFLPQPVMQDNVVYYLAVVEVAEEQRSLLRVDMSVTAHIQAGVKDDILWLPLATIRARPDGWYVLQRGPAGVVECSVRIGWQDQGRVEILEGLAEGDEVLLQQ